MLKRALAWLFPDIGGDEFGHHSYSLGAIVGIVLVVVVFSLMMGFVFTAK